MPLIWLAVPVTAYFAYRIVDRGADTAEAVGRDTRALAAAGLAGMVAYMAVLSLRK